jgi:hypothetical protein
MNLDGVKTKVDQSIDILLVARNIRAVVLADAVVSCETKRRGTKKQDKTKP